MPIEKCHCGKTPHIYVEKKFVGHAVCNDCRVDVTTKLEDLPDDAAKNIVDRWNKREYYNDTRVELVEKQIYIVYAVTDEDEIVTVKAFVKPKDAKCFCAHCNSKLSDLFHITHETEDIAQLSLWRMKHPANIYFKKQCRNVEDFVLYFVEASDAE